MLELSFAGTIAPLPEGVRSDFPRIVERTLPGGVGNGGYDVDLNAYKTFEVSLETMSAVVGGGEVGSR